MITREQFDEKWDYARGCINMRDQIWEFIEQEREQYQALVDGVKEIIDSMPQGDNSINGCKLRELYKPFLPPTSIADKLDAAVEDFLNYKMTVFEYNEKVQAIAAELREAGNDISQG